MHNSRASTYGVLGEEGAREPEEHPERWRQKMAQATTALCSGWVSDKVLSVFRYTSSENAHSLWRKLSIFYGNITDVRQLQLRDRAERYRQENLALMDWLGGLNSRVADLEASGHNCDDTYRKQLVRHNCNDRFRPIIQQLLLASPRSTYEEFSMALLEAAVDFEDSNRGNQRGYYSNRSRSRGRRSTPSRGASARTGQHAHGNV